LIGGQRFAVYLRAIAERKQETASILPMACKLAATACNLLAEACNAIAKARNNLVGPCNLLANIRKKLATGRNKKRMLLYIKSRA
jgi:hypothetical protein